MTTATRDQEIQAIHSQYLDFYRISGGLSLIVIGIWIGTLFFSDGYATNVYTEFLSVAATIAVIDQLNRRRDAQERKLALFRQVKSRSNDAAVEGLDQIQHEGWWDEMLAHYPSDNDKYRVDLSRVQWAGGVQLGKVNLQEADLFNANLQDAHLSRANLQSANLIQANLQSANLRSAKMRHAHLFEAKMQHANLYNANLQEARLGSANLTNANLQDANLRDAKYVESSNFNEKTILPDGGYWTPDTDMTRYTDPDHPDFRQPPYLKRDYAGTRPPWVTDDMLID